MSFRFFLTTLFTGIFFLPVFSASACECPLLTRDQIIAAADAIFVGTAEQISTENGQVKTLFSIQKSWGDLQKVTFVWSDIPGIDSCGPQFEQGEQYLIYAREFQNGLFTDSCAGNKVNPENVESFLGEPKAAYTAPIDIPNEKPASLEEESIFPDVPKQSSFRDAILYLHERDIIGGYSDGDFRPEKTISRAAFVKLITLSVFSEDKIVACKTNQRFSDVPQESWFAPYVCMAVEHGIVSGFPDGTFHPEKAVAFAGASKMIVNAFELEPLGAGEWFAPFARRLGMEKAIPTSVEYVSDQLTRAEVSEMLFRLLTKEKTKDSADVETILGQNCLLFDFETVANVDMNRIRETWLGWTNTARNKRGLKSYTLNNQLSRTATLWSEQAAQQGFISHKRAGQKEIYYDYWRMEEWFSNLGLTFFNNHRTTFTENIGWGPYRCSQADCTDELLGAIRTTFDFYMAEEGTGSTAHFESVVNPYFQEIGIGISVNPSGDTYFLTVHYGTTITSDPAPICG
ncbi:S-layer homology domain-containing protein [Candidatus Peregrinibacteria bacterium]|nr:MAG: S-layer homology domain-containing protein [Candidatus Peregrinibacteria bacterium]